MRANPELLRGFAGQVDSASSLIHSADAGREISGAADGLPGSTTQCAARLVGAQVAEVQARIAKNVSDMSTAVRGAGNRYEVEDDALAGKFKGLF
jgi:hypothetical protein